MWIDEKGHDKGKGQRAKGKGEGRGERFEGERPFHLP
jgi:hypothetical protein